MRSVKLTRAQTSALECSGLLEGSFGDAEYTLRRCWRRELAELHLANEVEAELCREALNDLSNAEDWEAEELKLGGETERARQSRGAATALANLMRSVPTPGAR